ncbi:hypothetical protein [Actinomycetospora soli]|uniref:hypothetical protein n=1 Tax=Actinomycetospora soli TaxID=2893887 RepID=UPI001E3B4651|nr:hypothetical protein [Actinomycetospora soli]MCD2191632.1 hypothetical protein [Actinomycetospora soli]
MDHAIWQGRAFGGQLAGMTLVASGSYLEGGGWEVYAVPDEPENPVRFRTWPPHPGFGGSVSLGAFSRTEAISVWSATGYSPDRLRVHRAFAVGAAAGSTTVIVTDVHGVAYELTRVATHPDGRTELFVGGTATLGPPDLVEAFGADHALLAQLHLSQD